MSDPFLRLLLSRYLLHQLSYLKVRYSYFHPLPLTDKEQGADRCLSCQVKEPDSDLGNLAPKSTLLPDNIY